MNIFTNLKNFLSLMIAKLFHNAPAARIVIFSFVLLMLAGLIWNKAHASNAEDAPYAQMSVGSTIVRGAAPVLDLTFTEPAPQLNKAFWQESLTIIGSSTYNGINAPNNMVLRGLFVDGIGHVDAGLGVSWMLNPPPYNGSNVNFNLQLDYRFTFLPITLTYTHFSNAGMRLPNLGRDLILVGYRFH